ncbi:MAG: ABC transporter permease [Bifidobacteriaceae bacterium]|jgi:NitT/TauT family transport system permease protein|nr:ABC transporter permease [Bifidobacteriaceae bacterium]
MTAVEAPTQLLLELEAAGPKSAPRAKVRTYVPDNRPIRPWVVAFWRACVVVAIVGGWEVGARLGAVNTFYWSSPSRILAKAAQQFASGTLWGDIAFTLTSAASGFLLGTVAGTCLGLSFWWSRLYAKTAEPFIVMFEAIPKLALAPIVVLVLGIGMSSKIAMATAMVMAVQALGAAAGVRQVDRDLVRMLASLGARRGKIFRSVVVPSTLPWLISGLRVTIGLALAGAIVGEFIGSQRGLGRLIVYAGSVYDIALIWVGVFVLALLSVALYLIVGFAERRLASTILASN